MSYKTEKIYHVTDPPLSHYAIAKDRVPVIIYFPYLPLVKGFTCNIPALIIRKVANILLHQASALQFRIQT